MSIVTLSPSLRSRVNSAKGLSRWAESMAGASMATARVATTIQRLRRAFRGIVVAGLAPAMSPCPRHDAALILSCAQHDSHGRCPPQYSVTNAITLTSQNDHSQTVSSNKTITASLRLVARIGVAFLTCPRHVGRKHFVLCIALTEQYRSGDEIL